MSSPKKRVVHLITRLDPGGSAENTLLSSELVDPERFDTCLWTGPGLSGAAPLNAARERLGERLTLIPDLVRPISPLRDIAALIDLAARLRKVKPDLLHVHSAKAGAIGRFAARMPGIDCPVIYTPHGHVFSGYGNETANRVFAIIERFLATGTDVIVALTSDEISEFKSHGANPRVGFEVIPSGVEIDRFVLAPQLREEVRAELGVAEDQPLVGFVGRLETIKGPDVFLETAARLLAERPKAKCLVVGDGSMREQLQERAVRLGIGSSLIWTGWREDVARLVGALDLLLVTSRNEGQGRVLVEAGAAGVPAVAMVTGGVGEVVVSGETGLLVQSGDVEAFVSAVLTLLDAPNKRVEMGIAARERAQMKFSVEVMIERLEALYSRLLDLES